MGMPKKSGGHLAGYRAYPDRNRQAIFVTARAARVAMTGSEDISAH